MGRYYARKQTLSWKVWTELRDWASDSIILSEIRECHLDSSSSPCYSILPVFLATLFDPSLSWIPN